MCQKVGYPTAAEARRDARIIQARKQHRNRRWAPPAANRKLRTYLCPRCDLYHLTSQRRRKR